MSTLTTKALRMAAAAAVVVLASQASMADTAAPSEQFAPIRKTIEANCADCYGASSDAFIHAVTALEALVSSGHTDPAAANLLAESYRVWAVVYSRDRQEQEALLHKAQVVYEGLLKETPADPKLLLAYYVTLTEPAKGLPLLLRAESVAPNDPEIQYQLGMLYAQGLNDPKTGIAHLERALELEETYTKARYGNQLAFVLELKGEKGKADEVRREMKAFQKELEERDRLKESKK